MAGDHSRRTKIGRAGFLLLGVLVKLVLLLLLNCGRGTAKLASNIEKVGGNSSQPIGHVRVGTGFGQSLHRVSDNAGNGLVSVTPHALSAYGKENRAFKHFPR
jgi:hypothetical protein